VSNLTDVVGVAAGYNYSLVLRSDGTVWGCGLNSTYGVLGDGPYKVYPRGTIVQASGLTDVVAIDAGMRHSLALKSDGTVWVCGTNEGGQLGDASTDNLNIPTRVIGLDNVVAIAGGLIHTLALKSDGTVWACGYNDKGQLGNGTFDITFSYVHQVSNLTNIVAIAAGSTHNLALKADGTVWAWGANSSGQLGNGTNDNSNIPVQVSGLTHVYAIAAGGNQSLAVVQSTPTVTPTPALTPTSTSTSTLTVTPKSMLTSTTTTTSTSTQESLSGSVSINSWWVWLILGLVVVAVVGIVWSIRHKNNG
jgi:alpha-tubulin suppressor-like RCC1 family protein